MQLEKERYEILRDDGKMNYMTSHIPGNTKTKPYMYMSRDSCYTLKQKLEAKGKLQPLEYVDAVLSLLMT